MTATTPAAVAGRGGLRRDVVAALAVTTTVGYGVLYYAFSALLEPMRTDLRIFRRMFITGLLLAGAVYMIALTSLHLFDTGKGAR